MSNNPLSGLSVPSLEDIASEIAGRFHGVIDFDKPLNRERVRRFIFDELNMYLDSGFRHQLCRATEMAVEHVFALMEDQNYQKERSARRKAAQARKVDRVLRERDELAAKRLARKMEVPSGPIQ